MFRAQYVNVQMYESLGINPSPSSAAYMRHAYSAPSHYISKPMLGYCQLGP